MSHIFRPLRFSSGSTFPSIVSVYRLEGNQKGKFLRFETPEGVECDEHGVPLGVIHFKIKGVRV